MGNSFGKSLDSLILIVDDQPENLQILGNILGIYNYKKALANNGFEALEVAEKVRPDLILLDIMMPNMDGYEVCERLKLNPITADIPVIFLTAKSQDEDIIHGFEKGGVDYITKPFKQNELLVRIKTHIDLKKSHDLIKFQNEALVKLNQDKSELMSITAHDLKNPLQVMVGFSKLLEENTEQFTSVEIKEIAKDIKDAGESMFRIISDLLDLNAVEEGAVSFNLEKFNINDLIRSIIDQYRHAAKDKDISIELLRTPQLYIESDPGRIAQIFDNLISNALKFSPMGKKIFITTDLVTQEHSRKKRVQVRVKDEGPGIAPEDFEKLFVKFARLRAKPTNNENSTRLGLSIVRKFTELLEGKVWCESEYGQGATFILELPESIRKKNK
jgi:two-component system, sensor histidine kinase and response regulator